MRLHPSSCLSSLEKKSLLRDNVDLLVSLADVYFRAGDTKNAILKFEQAQMLDPYLIKGELPDKSLCPRGFFSGQRSAGWSWGVCALRERWISFHLFSPSQEWMFMDTWWPVKDTWRMLKSWEDDYLISQTSMQSPGWSLGESLSRQPLEACYIPVMLSFCNPLYLFLYLFSCHSFYSKRYSRALYLGAKAIQLNSNSVQALLLKGAALRNMGRVQEAIIHFREAMRLAPCRLDCYEGT